MRHSTIQSMLYDFLMNELPERDREIVEQHLASCSGCSRELADLKQALQLLPTPTEAPSDAQNEAYWKSLSLAIESSIDTRRVTQPRPFAGLYDRVISFFTFRPAYGFAAGASLAVAIVALVLFRTASDESPIQMAKSSIDSSIVLAQHETDQRMSRYFSKSKTLLVGLANLQEEESSLDLRAEQKLSRRLVREARYLQQQPLDGRSAKLIADLQKILIELANLEEGNDLPNVELIRSGIRKENLLFKIRMAEEAFDTTKNHSTQKSF
ncbi:MAG: zf-HC2 domain-containing protein [Ignavibacteriae bacterium]|nr:zf-HC2 domain-containing protein [Ignavibacteriota bacterium]